MAEATLWIGTTKALSAQPADSSVTRLIASDAQRPRLSLITFDTPCESDTKTLPHGVVSYTTRQKGHGRDDELEVTNVTAHGPWPCVVQGQEVCAALHSFADVFMPDADVPNRDAVKAMADTFGCRADLWPDLAPSEFWTVAAPGTYMVLKPGGWDYTGSRIWVGSEDGMPDTKEGDAAGRTDDKPASRLYVSRVAFGSLARNAVALSCDNNMNNGPDTLLVSFQDGFQTVRTCALHGAPACNYLHKVSASAATGGVVATRLKLYGQGLKCL